MSDTEHITRRTTLKSMGAVSAAAVFSSVPAQAADQAIKPPQPMSDIRQHLFDKVFRTPFIDTHEHLLEERQRLQGTSHNRVPCDDFALLLTHYIDSDLMSSGMTAQDYGQLRSPNVDPQTKWKLLATHWPAVRNTGYGQAVELSMSQLYDVPELNEQTIGKIIKGYQAVRRPGFYLKILKEMALIESCQVNSLGGPFGKSDMPEFLMQDIGINGMITGPNAEYEKPTGMTVQSLGQWYKVIDWWFDTYGDYAVAVKSQLAYSRGIDFKRVPTSTAGPIFKKRTEKLSVSSVEKKQLEDHLFWYAVEKATEKDLPIKLHTGYYAGLNSMPLARLIHNAGSACELCQAGPQCRFVFMHICYPYYEEILSVAKQWSNAYIDMCWSWIINPIAAKDFLKKYLVTAPANKIFTFGGDFMQVEPVLGHAIIARRGIAQALSELVEEGWVSLDRALQLADMVMHENATAVFNLKDKTRRLKQAPWKT